MIAANWLALHLGGRATVLRASVQRPRLWLLMVILAGLVGAALPLVWLGQPAQEETQALERTGASLRGERDRARARLDASAREIERIETELTELPQAEPNGAPADALLPHRLAVHHGLHLERLKTASSEGGPMPRAASAPAERPAPLTLQVRGSYRSLLAYLAALEQTGPAWSIRQLQLSAGRPYAHRMSLVLEPVPPSPWTVPQPSQMLVLGTISDPLGLPLETLWARADPPPPAPRNTAPVEPSPPQDPLAGLPPAWRSEFERQRGPLESLALQELFLTGTLKRGQAWLALMRVGSVVHTVAVGDYIGPDLGRVQAVDETGLELREIRRDPSGRWVEQLRRWPLGVLP